VLIRETRTPLPASRGGVVRYDYEYERCGVCNVFPAVEPLVGRRIVEVTERKTKKDWALFIERIAGLHPEAEKITLVMDNLSTHGPGALSESFPAAVAKGLWDRFEFVYTPKHGSWLNMAEIEFSVLARQCLARRIDNLEEMRGEVESWRNQRNNANAKIDWRFTSEDARIKLRRLYPTFHT
jgi:transposase